MSQIPQFPPAQYRPTWGGNLEGFSRPRRRSGRSLDWTGPGELPRRLQRLANEALVTADRPHPAAELVCLHCQAVNVVLAGRATSVPFTKARTRLQRTTTDNAMPVLTCAVRCRCRWQSRSIWLWEQGVAGSNPAVPTTSTNVPGCSPASSHCERTGRRMYQEPGPGLAGAPGRGLRAAAGRAAGRRAELDDWGLLGTRERR
jgi:hypothetical protein